MDESILLIHAQRTVIYGVAEAMRFAINEINDRTDILPNVTLGYDIIDDTWSEPMSVEILKVQIKMMDLK